MVRRHHHTPLRTSLQDIDATRRIPRTPQTESSAYTLAFSDEEFMTSEELRGVRFQLEYLKPEIMLSERGINSTVVLFGGARIPAPGKEAWAAKTDIARKNLEASSRYYNEARLFAQYASLTSKALDHKEYVVVTGGGPGVMEAGNLGASEVDAPSIAFNIVLPHDMGVATVQVVADDDYAHDQVESWELNQSEHHDHIHHTTSDLVAFLGAL